MHLDQRAGRKMKEFRFVIVIIYLELLITIFSENGQAVLTGSLFPICYPSLTMPVPITARTLTTISECVDKIA
jgi:hypothetical protein